MEKRYTDSEVITILVNSCNNFCAYADYEEHKESVTEFAKWVIEQKAENVCDREVTFGDAPMNNLRKHGSLFPPRK